MFLDTEIAEFKSLYKSRFNINIDDGTARKKLSLLVRQMEIIYQPIKKLAIVKYENEEKDELERPAESI